MKCPKCRTDLDLRVIQCDEDLRKIFELLPAFGSHSRLAFEYAELFGVTPIGIKTKKLARLLGEVAALFLQKKFTWKKAEYGISEKGIVEGLRITCSANLVTPLKDHNYLRAVLAKIANDERTESRAAMDADLRRREERATTKARRDESTQEERVLSAEENSRRARELAQKIGQRL